MSSKLELFDNIILKKDAFESLSSQFKNQKDFDMFYLDLKDDQVKDNFLRVGSMYLFFVKNGDWHVNIKRSKPVIGYLTNSFKLVSIFSIIKSLDNKKNIDFFQWLNKNKKSDLYPIKNNKKLKEHYDSYKEDYGSMNNVQKFFNNLSKKTQFNLCKLVTVKVNGNKEIVNIKKIITLIYQARSNFVHLMKYTLEIGDNAHIDRTKKNTTILYKFKFEYLLNAVEEGIFLHFKALSKNHIKS